MDIKEFFDYEVYGNEVVSLISSPALALIVFILLNVLKKVALKRLEKILEKEKDNTFASITSGLISRLKNLFFLYLSMYIASQLLSFSPSIERIINITAIIIFILQFSLLADQAVKIWSELIIRKHESEDVSIITVMSLSRLLGRVIIWAIAFLLVLDNVGFNITTLIAGLGVGGLAVSLAAQNILKDLFASVSIILDKPFEVGDFIIVGDFFGDVSYIGLKTTHVTSLSGERIIFSNTDLLESRIRNFKHMKERRIVFQIGVVYGTEQEKLIRVPEIIREAIKTTENTRFDRSHFKNYGDFSLNFESVYYVLDPDYTIYMGIQEKINLKIYKSFEQENIEFAYPTQTLYINQISNSLSDNLQDTNFDLKKD